MQFEKDRAVARASTAAAPPASSGVLSGRRLIRRCRDGRRSPGLCARRVRRAANNVASEVRAFASYAVRLNDAASVYVSSLFTPNRGFLHVCRPAVRHPAHRAPSRGLAVLPCRNAAPASAPVGARARAAAPNPQRRRAEAAAEMAGGAGWRSSPAGGCVPALLHGRPEHQCLAGQQSFCGSATRIGNRRVCGSSWQMT